MLTKQQFVMHRNLCKMIYFFILIASCFAQAENVKPRIFSDGILILDGYEYSENQICTLTDHQKKELQTILNRYDLFHEGTEAIYPYFPSRAVFIIKIANNYYWLSMIETGKNYNEKLFHLWTLCYLPACAALPGRWAQAMLLKAMGFDAELYKVKMFGRELKDFALYGTLIVRYPNGSELISTGIGGSKSRYFRSKGLYEDLGQFLNRNQFRIKKTGEQIRIISN